MKITTKAVILSSTVLLVACSSQSKIDNETGEPILITGKECRDAFKDMSTSTHMRSESIFQNFDQIQKAFSKLENDIESKGPLPLSEFKKRGFSPSANPAKKINIRQTLNYYTAGYSPESKAGKGLIPAPIQACIFTPNSCKGYVYNFEFHKSTEAAYEGASDVAKRITKFKDSKLIQDSSYMGIAVINERDHLVVNAMTLSEQAPTCKTRIEKEGAGTKVRKAFQSIFPW